MVTNETAVQIQVEESMVAELAQLGVRYLSRQNTNAVIQIHAPHKLLAELVCQPSSRVRTALIALLLAHPEYAEHIPAALKVLHPKQAQTLKIFYTAAFLLQQEYAALLQTFLGAGWRRLPDLFSNEFKLEKGTPQAQRMELAKVHAQWTGEQINWAGTYENAARHLLRRWEIEQTTLT